MKSKTFLVVGWIGWIFFFAKACDSADGYHFAEKEFQKQSIALDVRVFADRDELIAEAERVGVEDAERVDAFASYYQELSGEESNRCIIHVLDPAKNQWEPGTIGHEVAHCIWGNFHPAQDSAAR